MKASNYGLSAPLGLLATLCCRSMTPHEGPDCRLKKLTHQWHEHRRANGLPTWSGSIAVPDRPCGHPEWNVRGRAGSEVWVLLLQLT